MSGSVGNADRIWASTPQKPNLPGLAKHKITEIFSYSKIRNYLYTNAMARIQSSPAVVGRLFPDKL